MALIFVRVPAWRDIPTDKVPYLTAAGASMIKILGDKLIMSSWGQIDQVICSDSAIDLEAANLLAERLKLRPTVDRTMCIDGLTRHELAEISNMTLAEFRQYKRIFDLSLRHSIERQAAAIRASLTPGTLILGELPILWSMMTADELTVELSPGAALVIDGDIPTLVHPKEGHLTRPLCSQSP